MLTYVTVVTTPGGSETPILIVLQPNIPIRKTALIPVSVLPTIIVDALIAALAFAFSSSAAVGFPSSLAAR